MSVHVFIMLLWVLPILATRYYISHYMCICNRAAKLTSHTIIDRGRIVMFRPIAQVVHLNHWHRLGALSSDGKFRWGSTQPALGIKSEITLITMSPFMWLNGWRVVLLKLSFQGAQKHFGKEFCGLITFPWKMKSE